MLNLKSKKKLILGTAQFGLKYGIMNKGGKTSFKEIAKIISLQKKHKINYIDTAQAYNFEKTYKNFNLKKFNLILKLEPLKNIKDPEQTIIENILRIKKKFKVKHIFCLMVHHSQDLLMKDGKKLYKTLKYLKDHNFVKKIGFSTYGAENILKILKKFKFDIVQTTFNPFDRRILENNVRQKLKKRRVEVHVRSIFLQGLLLSEFDKIPIKLKKFENKFKAWKIFLRESGLKPLDICLNYVLSKNFDKIIIGVNNHKQLKEILNCDIKKISVPSHISTKNKFLVNPYNWS